MVFTYAIYHIFKIPLQAKITALFCNTWEARKFILKDRIAIVNSIYIVEKFANKLWFNDHQLIRKRKKYLWKTDLFYHVNKLTRLGMGSSFQLEEILYFQNLNCTKSKQRRTCVSRKLNDVISWKLANATSKHSQLSIKCTRGASETKQAMHWLCHVRMGSSKPCLIKLLRTRFNLINQSRMTKLSC